MALTFGFTSQDGLKLFWTWGLKLGDIPTDERVYSIAKVFDRATLFKNKNDGNDKVDNNAWGAVAPQCDYVAFEGDNPQSIFKDKGILGRRWIAKNGNSVLIYKESFYYSAKFYNKAGEEVHYEKQISMPSKWAQAYLPFYENYNQFLDFNVNSKFFTAQAKYADPHVYISGCDVFTVATTWKDPFRAVLLFDINNPPPKPDDPDDPYPNPDPSEPSNPVNPDGSQGFPDNEGTWNDPDDPIDIPENPPFFGAGSSGFLTMYAPSWFQLNQLASFMWSEDFFNQIVKLWADPMQVIMGLNILPVKIPTSQNAEIMVGNVSSGVQAPIASQQYVYVDMGSVELKKFYGSYMDFAPYTKITLVLPYIGAKELITDEVMGKVINVSYRIDILTGACVAYVKCGQSVLYQFSGNCGENIPVTSASYTEMLTAYTKLAGDAATMAVTGGGAAGGNVISSSINAIASVKPNIAHTGTLASSCGAMGVLKPYIIKTKPRICLPKEQYKIEGLPSFVETAFTTCKGFTQVHATRLQGIPATDEELEMIYAQLKEGVVF